ncbi:hypothetical protein AMD24_00126 [Candidatus Xiphinematobacter sp. Idaho Grape]|uniref:hypothetical protein n=1 Tax=Candidatus Xiphinematobacter sp. Idaho Grape TaxID=1704307 RepID=UPI0007066794|nr:hypothetical protein [Candidatus Xiphinematobacter sp. Idaho Grape]ALJ56321.1 hypothetical protein AMD24_00126 [Candidatus Xiphinematobacter sp. Idaho Grape]
MNAELQSIEAMGIVAISAVLLLRGAMRKSDKPCKGGCGCHMLKRSLLKKSKIQKKPNGVR